jgi:hypothetical protein
MKSPLDRKTLVATATGVAFSLVVFTGSQQLPVVLAQTTAPATAPGAYRCGFIKVSDRQWVNLAHVVHITRDPAGSTTILRLAPEQYQTESALLPEQLLQGCDAALAKK